MHVPPDVPRLRPPRAFLVSGCVLAVLLLGGAAEARARPRPDGRIDAVKRFWACLRGERCPVRQVFRGATALEHWRRQDRKRRTYGVRLKQAELYPRVPEADWHQRMQAAVKQLAAAGYRTDALRRLGKGHVVAQVGPRAAVALTRTVIVARGRASTTVLLMVLWRAGARWYVASWECKPDLMLRFMLKHKPG